uniref:Uncharacterized protein n=1 Tax=Tetraselmis sp. GSL018 TaxID=582737 RepID=A0A061SHV1_9CHLO
MTSQQKRPLKALKVAYQCVTLFVVAGLVLAWQFFHKKNGLPEELLENSNTSISKATSPQNSAPVRRFSKLRELTQSYQKTPP